jgi:stringent starvation protein B
MAIYSRENNQGMSFPVQIPEKKKEPVEKEEKAIKENADTTNKSKSHLKLVK